jgi:hypothetical protein
MIPKMPKIDAFAAPAAPAMVSEIAHIDGDKKLAARPVV